VIIFDVVIITVILMELFFKTDYPPDNS